MTVKTKPHVAALAAGFRKLPKRQRANLAWHEREGTRILCGKNSQKVIEDVAG